jgi:hypothetical protein
MVILPLEPLRDRPVEIKTEPDTADLPTEPVETLTEPLPREPKEETNITLPDLVLFESPDAIDTAPPRKSPLPASIDTSAPEPPS